MLNEEIKKATRESYGEAIAELGKENKNIFVLDADLAGATKSDIFKKVNPDRFIDVGISEQDLVGTACGLTSFGKIPFASSFSVFMAGRAYDQIRMSVAYANNNVKLVGSHAGITVGEDGATHQMLEDISMMRNLPNMKVFSVSDDVQTKAVVKYMAENYGPCYLRTSRVKTPKIYDDNEDFSSLMPKVFGDGKDALVFATGVTVAEALRAQNKLAEENINITVVDIYCIKPIDDEFIVNISKDFDRIVTVEDHMRVGGIGSLVCEILSEKCPKKVTRMGLENFGQSGKAEDLLKYYKIDSEAIINEIKNS